MTWKPCLKAVSAGNALAVAIEAESSGVADEDEEEADEPAGEHAAPDRGARRGCPRAHGCNFRSRGHVVNGFEQEAAGARLRSALGRRDVPKAVHDYKAAIHAFEPQGITLRGVRHDPMLYSYLLDPTYSSHRLAEVALRRFNLKLSGTLAESADVTGRLAAALRREVEQAGSAEAIRRNRFASGAGACADGARRGQDRSRSSGERCRRGWNAKSRPRPARSSELAGSEFNINSPKQLGDVLFNNLNLPKPVKYGKGKTISTAVDVLEALAKATRLPARFWNTASSRSSNRLTWMLCRRC